MIFSALKSRSVRSNDRIKRDRNERQSQDTRRPNYRSVHRGQRVGTTSNDTQIQIRCKYVKAKRCFPVESNLILLSSSLLLRDCISSDIFYLFSTILFIKTVKRVQDTEIASNSKTKYLKTVYILSLPRS